MTIKISAEPFDDSQGVLRFLGYVGLTAGPADLLSCPSGSFDAQFSFKEKQWMPSQEEFYIYSHSSVVR